MTVAIRGAEQLAALFGRWPSFHDAEVVRVVLDRDAVSGHAFGPTLTLDIYAFEAGPAVAPNAQHISRNESVSQRIRDQTQLPKGQR